MSVVPFGTAWRALYGRIRSAEAPHIDYLGWRLFVIVGVLMGAAWLGVHPSLNLALAIYGAMFVVVLARWPRLWLPWLLLAAAFVPFDVKTGTGSPLNIALIGVILLSVLWITQMLAKRHVSLVPARSNWPWLLLMLVAGFSILAGGAMWNPWVTVGSGFLTVQLAQWAIYILSGCAFWLPANIGVSRSNLRVLVRLMLWLGLVLILELLPLGSGISSLFLLDGPIFRIWVVSLASALALFDLDRPRWQRLALLVFAVVFVLGAWRQEADWQSGWLPPLIALGAIVAVRLGQGLTRAATIAALPGLLFVGTAILPRLAQSDQWSLGTRIVAWRGLLDLLHDRWLFGLGLASYWHYWSGVFGSMSYLDPNTGYQHVTFTPKVNMHNNYMDILGQMGILGLLVFAWLCVAIYRDAGAQFRIEPPGFGRAYVAACTGAFTGMLAAGMLADWMLPFVYNIGLIGFRDSFLGWMLLGGLVLLKRTHGEAPNLEPVTSQLNS